MEKAGRPKRAAIVLGIALASCPRVFALDPSLDVTQYAHTAWKVGEGLPNGFIRAIAQTPDGYLWLGTEFGLLRFDCQRQLKIPQIAKVKFPTPISFQGRFSVAPAGAEPSAAGVWRRALGAAEGGVTEKSRA